jgi:hypothetical protein
MAWGYPELEVKSANNTSKTIYISDAVVRVTRSTPNRRPVLFVASDADFVDVHNMGWGPAKDVVFQFDVDPTKPVASTGNRYSKRIGDIAAGGRASLALREIVPDMGSGASRSYIGGTLSFQTTENISGQLLFEDRLNGGGGYGDVQSSKQKYGLKLEAGKYGFEKTISVNQYLKPGEVDRFPIVVYSDRSAQYELTITFRSTGGNVLGSKNVALNLFVPNSLASSGDGG